MPLSLKEAVKEMQIEEAVDLLAEISQELIKRCELKRGPEGARGERGDQGPKGDTGASADVAEIVRAAQRVMQDELQSAKDALREIVVVELKQSGVIDSSGRAILIPGPPGKDGRGVDGRDSTIPGPKGDVGSAGYTPKKGIDYFDGRDADVKEVVDLAEKRMTELLRREVEGAVKAFITSLGDLRGRDGKDGKSIVGERGAQGPSGATLEEVEKLIREIISTLGDEALRKFVALNQEIQKIANDPRYQRVDSVRREWVGRLTACQEIEPVRVVHVQTPPSPPPPPPTPPATLPPQPTAIERGLRWLHLIR